jgi:hypothetical protein
MNDDLGDLAMPAPIVRATPEEADQRFGEPTLENPRAVARGWLHAAIEGDQDAFDFMCDDPTAWGIEVVQRMLGPKSGLASRLRWSEEHPDDVVTMMVLKDFADHTVVVFDPMEVESYPLTMVRQQDNTWRVWRVGGDIPRGSEVFQEREEDPPPAVSAGDAEA